MTNKQREELQRISAAFITYPIGYGFLNLNCKMSLQEIKHIVDTILAEPIRNCDVGTAEEQYRRFRECCTDRKIPCRRSYTFGCAECYAKWSQMPYETVETNKTKTNKGK